MDTKGKDMTANELIDLADKAKTPEETYLDTPGDNLHSLLLLWELRKAYRLAVQLGDPSAAYFSEKSLVVAKRLAWD